MQKSTFLLFLILAVQTEAQVVDVNGDKIIGPEEAIAVAEQWKGPANAANDHDHLGQTWEGQGTPIRIQGNFSEPISIPPLGTKSKTVIPQPIPRSPSAPLVLRNTNPEGYGLKVESNGTGAFLSGSNSAPDLVLGGLNAILAATEESSSDIVIRANGGIQVRFDFDGEAGNIFAISGPNGLAAAFFANGDLLLFGAVQKSADRSIIDHPLDPPNKFLVHSSVESPEMKNVYDGVVMLDAKGEATIQLPNYFEAFNSDFRYQLTCIGGFAPVYVVEKIKDNQFKIAGGEPNQEVSWMVTGVRSDAYAKANPIKVEQEKSKEEKGKYLHPELFGKPAEKSVGLVQGFENE